MEQFTFRTATNRDTGRIVFLVKKVLPEFGLLYSPETSERDLQDIEATYMKNGGTFEVIENEKREIIGTVALLKLDNKQCKMRKMYVDKRYRKSGLGRKLMERMLAKATELGFSEIILETVHSMTAAIALYEKYGFRRIEGHTAASPRCDIVMSKKLNAQ